MKKWIYIICAILAIIFSLFIFGLTIYKILYGDKEVPLSSIIEIVILITPYLLIGIYYLFIGIGKFEINKSSEISLKFMIISLIIFIVSYFLAPSFVFIIVFPLIIAFILEVGAFIFMIISIINNIKGIEN